MSDIYPLIGSALIALVTLIVLVANQRQNRQTLELARKQHSETLEAAASREWLQWKRNKLATLCDEILSVAHQASSRINAAPQWKMTEFASNWINETNRISVIPDLSARVSLVVRDQLEAEISDVWNSLIEALAVAQSDPVGLTSHVSPIGFLNDTQQQLQAATKKVALSSRDFANAARLLLEAPPTDQTSSPHSTEPTDPAAPGAPGAPVQDA
ncbi:hypothetical protein [Williamsia sp. 1138]|uniref:hypothetical protein n=1 Tax=Williamsia sp. 1138 TaxID=1903117 RepID=UPI00117F77E2|nr:hypothetical protein [Williamsia sp. 1138]